MVDEFQEGGFQICSHSCSSSPWDITKTEAKFQDNWKFDHKSNYTLSELLQQKNN